MSLFATAARASFRNAHRLPPLKKRKSPVVAFLLGLVFGFIGVGLYVSWIDALVVLTVFLVGTFASVGVAAPVFWLFFGCYAAIRVMYSNRALDQQTAGPPVEPADEEIEPDAVAGPAALNQNNADLSRLRQGVAVMRR